MTYMETSYTLSTKQQFELKCRYHFDTTPFNKKIFQLLLEKLGMPEKPEKKQVVRRGRNQAKVDAYKTIDNPIQYRQVNKTPQRPKSALNTSQKPTKRAKSKTAVKKQQFQRTETFESAESFTRELDETKKRGQQH